MKIHNILLSVFLILATTIVVTASTGFENELKSNSADMFVQICCIYNEMGTAGGVLNVPVTITVMDNNLNPISGANVTLRILNNELERPWVSIDGIYDYVYSQRLQYGGIVKKTGSTGVVKFKVKAYSYETDEGYKLDVIVTKGTRKTEIGMFFKVLGDF